MKPPRTIYIKWFGYQWLLVDKNTENAVEYVNLYNPFMDEDINKVLFNSGYTIDDILNDKRTIMLKLTRLIITKIMYEKLKNYSEVGRKLKRDARTIMHSIKVFNDLMKTDKFFNNYYKQLIR